MQAPHERQGPDYEMLPKSYKEFKEDIVLKIDALIERQNGVDPIAKMETFEVETASRKVLRELVDTFLDVQKEQNKKINSLQSEQTLTKNK